MQNISQNIAGKTILVAGGIDSIAPGIVRRLLEQDATVIVPVMSLHQLYTLKDYVKDIFTGNLITQLTDIDDYERIFEIAEIIVEQYGKIDIAISVFNHKHYCSKLLNTKISDWQKMIDEEVTPFFISSNIVLNMMKENVSALYISVSEEYTDENNDTPLSKISITAKMEMAKIFSSEVSKRNIRYHHIQIPKTSKSLSLTEVEQNLKTGYEVVDKIIQLYETPQKAENNLFLLLKDEHAH